MKVIFFVLLCVTACLAFIEPRSSHSEAPGTAKAPFADITDFYAFRSYEANKDQYVVFLINTIPLQSPNAGPNYYSPSDRHFFEINIDNDADCVEDIVIQWFNGNSLGGNIAQVVQIDDDPCGNFSMKNVSAHEGIKIAVGNPNAPPSEIHNVSVALKFVNKINSFIEDDPVLNWREWYQMNIIHGDRSGTQEVITDAADGSNQFWKPFDYAGQNTFPNYENYATGPSNSFIRTLTIPGCTPSSGAAGRVFVGQRKESFSIALGKVFDLINFVPVTPGTFSAPNDNVGVADCPEHNELAEKNVLTYALEIHQECIAGNATVIGAWATTRVLTHIGTQHIPGQQVSRLGNPLVNELVIGLNDKAKFSIGHPTGDGQFLEYVEYPTLPEIVDLLFLGAVNGITGASFDTLAPNVPREDLVIAFLKGVPGLNANGPTCEYMRLNLAIPPTPAAQQNHMGVIEGDNAGFPNGRRPGDDVVDIALRVMMGRLCHLEIGCNATDAPVGNLNFTDGSPNSVNDFRPGFPFLQTPNPGSIAYAGTSAYICAADASSDGGDGTTGDGGGDGCGSASSVISSWISFLF